MISFNKHENVKAAGEEKAEDERRERRGRAYVYHQHGFIRDTSIRVHLLEHFVDVETKV